MTEQLKSLYQPENTVAAVSAGEKLKEAFSEVTMLVATPQMRKRTCLVYFSWLVVAMVYYGLSFNTKNIGADIYVSNFISGFVECVACVVIIPALSKFGRVKIYSGTFLAGGLSCVLVAVILWVTAKFLFLELIIGMAF